MTDSPASPTSGDETTVGILSYCTPIGFIVAVVMHNKQKSQFGAFHLQQALGLIVAAIAGGIALGILNAILIHFPIIGDMLVKVINGAFCLAVLALAVIGILNAVNRKAELLPVIGAHIQKYLGKAFV